MERERLGHIGGRAHYMDADECVSAKQFFYRARVVPDFPVDCHIS